MLSARVEIVNSFKIYGANAGIAFICMDLQIGMVRVHHRRVEGGEEFNYRKEFDIG
jgi:hypothetical protein